VNARAWDDLLGRYPARVQPLSQLESLGGAGGLSGARLWRFRAEQGRLLLRAWPPHGPGRKHLERVHHWLSLTADLGFVPVPIRDRAGDSLQEWQGRLWEITPWLAGATGLSCPPALEHLRLAFTGLAAFLERLACEQVEGVSAGLRHRHQALTQLVQGGFDMLEAAINMEREPRTVRHAAALAWLTLARSMAPTLLDPLARASTLVIPLQPCLRDARPEHFLFDGDRLSGLVDFGAMGVDSVAGDLARLIGEWFDGDPSARPEALACFERVRPLDPAETGLIGLFESATSLLIGERWVRWHYLEHRLFDDPEAISKGLERSLKQIEKLNRESAGPRLAPFAGRIGE